LSLAPRWTSTRTGSQVFEADCRAVAATLPDGCASLAILDGPYGMGKAAWDRVPRGGSLADLYRDHLADVGRLCGASASLYVWNTAAGWGEIHPLALAAGWTFRSLIVWDKMTPPSLIGWRSVGSWPDSHEVCGFYQRGGPHFAMPEPIGTVWQVSTKALSLEMLRSGVTIPHRAQGEGEVQEALHPCQKPLAFAARMIRASSRPGDTVWAPFGGTLRELVAAERIAAADPTDARRVITCELNADGADYIGPALEQVNGAPMSAHPKQALLFRGDR
jgi:site-specific DNA-methyltransferase (adenine-specific)